MRILVVNPNTTTSMTDAVARAARGYASPGTEIVGLTAGYGVDGIDSAFESLLSAVAVMDRVTTYPDPFDAVVMAGFGEHGREGLMELLDVPVVDMAEASAHVAMMLGRSYTVVTTLARSIAAIEDRLSTAGLRDRCSGVRATGMSTTDVERDPDAAVRAVVEQARLAVEQDRAEVVCLGCGGMAGLEDAVRDALGVPVVDGVGAAVRLAESLVGLGLSTSKVCTYARPDSKPTVGWPVSAHLRGGAE
ncbi:aspartate/glutamate racemase family protein [Kineosporia sp. R_H_3]|uniref:aspartate/glutamate racemase family protein n=1 Tax=Kineosporia sp. R_H_3 TaxID=1961848 RepID=UPI000B4B1CAB|nr:aspartate/glutamate racemase family protein [Kineosporia sp. R_H_3]